MRKTETVGLVKETTWCDLCGGRVTRMYGPKTCLGCGRDVCDKCSTFAGSDPIYGDGYGDCEPVICQTCWPISEEFRVLSAAIRDAVDETLEALRIEWRDKCKAAADAGGKHEAE